MFCGVVYMHRDCNSGSNNLRQMKSIFVVMDPKGKVWSDTVATTIQSCQVNFAKAFHSGWPVAIDYHLAWSIWGVYERIGFKIEEIELPKK